MGSDATSKDESNRLKMQRAAIYIMGALVLGFFLMLQLNPQTPHEPHVSSQRGFNQTVRPFVQPAIDSDAVPMGEEVDQLMVAMEEKLELLASHPFIFIGGVPRSGTTLLRAILESHPDIRCGQETRLAPRVAIMMDNWSKPAEQSKLEEAGVTHDLLVKAIRSFYLELIVRHASAAWRYCNKDPLMLRFAPAVNEAFPNALHVHMVRDGRAVAHSLYTKKIKVTGATIDTFEESLQWWNKIMRENVAAKNEMGRSGLGAHYREVRYEELVAEPERVLRQLLKWLGEPWNKQVMHHEQFAHDLSSREPTTGQVVKPLYDSAVNEWQEDWETLIAKRGQDAVAAQDYYQMLVELGYL